MKFASTLAACAVALCAASSASASTVTLLNLTNPTGSMQSYSLSFVATGTTTTLSVGGYQLPGFTDFQQNSVVQQGDTTNLLGQTWDFTPAASGSDAGQQYNGASVNQLVFGGVVVGSYDVFSQTFATTAGTTYDYTFYVPYFDGTPDGFYVTASNAAAVPEPAEGALLLAGLGLMGGLLRKRARADRQAA